MGLKRALRNSKDKSSTVYIISLSSPFHCPRHSCILAGSFAVRCGDHAFHFYSINITYFLLSIKLFLTFVIFAKTRVTMRFRAKNAGYNTGLSQVCATSYGDGRTYGHLTITSLPKFLSLIDNHFFLYMVLRGGGFAARSFALNPNILTLKCYMLLFCST